MAQRVSSRELFDLPPGTIFTEDDEMARPLWILEGPTVHRDDILVHELFEYGAENESVALGLSDLGERGGFYWWILDDEDIDTMVGKIVGAQLNRQLYEEHKNTRKHHG